MNNFDDIFNKLKTLGYSNSQIYQLIFLYNYYEENEILEEFDLFLKKINVNYNEDCLEEIIKCITHGTYYNLFICNEKLDKTTMNELRGFWEDSKKMNERDQYRIHYISKKIILYKWNPNIIYQFRRFLKSESVTIDLLEYMCDFIIENKIEDWMILNALCNIYIKFNHVELKNFMSTNYFKELIHKYTINKYYKLNFEVDKLLIFIYEYATNWKTV